MKTILASICTLLLFAAICHASPNEGWIRLHPEPFDVTPIVTELPASHPAIGSAAPVLISSSANSVQRQSPWRWTEVNGTFTGYVLIDQLVEDEFTNQPVPIYSAPDSESPILIRADALGESFRFKEVEGPFKEVQFESSLLLFFDSDLPPFPQKRTHVDPAEDEEVPALPTEDEPSPTLKSTGTTTAPPEITMPPADPGTPLRTLSGTIVTARSLGRRRAPLPHVLISPRGHQIAFIDLRHIVASTTRGFFNQPVIVVGESFTINGELVIEARSIRPQHR